MLLKGKMAFTIPLSHIHEVDGDLAVEPDGTRQQYWFLLP